MIGELVTHRISQPGPRSMASLKHFAVLIQVKNVGDPPPPNAV